MSANIEQIYKRERAREREQERESMSESKRERVRVREREMNTHVMQNPAFVKRTRTNTYDWARHCRIWPMLLLWRMLVLVLALIVLLGLEWQSWMDIQQVDKEDSKLENQINILHNAFEAQLERTADADREDAHSTMKGLYSSLLLF